MVTKFKAHWPIPLLFALVVLGALLCYLRFARANTITVVEDVGVHVLPPVAQPDALSVNTQTDITVTAKIWYMPSAILPEAYLGCPQWSFTFVSAKYVTAQPTGGFSNTYDWSGVPNAAPGTAYTLDFGDPDPTSTNGGNEVGSSATKSFKFTPLTPGYWHIVVNAQVKLKQPVGDAGDIVYHIAMPGTPSPPASLAGADSPSTGFPTLTAVQLDIVWVGETITDTNTPPGSVPSGTTITNKTCNMIIGKRVMLKASAAPSDLTLVLPAWVVPHTVGPSEPGCAVLGFTTDPTPWDWSLGAVMTGKATGSVNQLDTPANTSAYLEQLPPGELDFYWSMISSASENDVVKYKVYVTDAIGQNIGITSETTFALHAPTVTGFNPALLTPIMDALFDGSPGSLGQPFIHLGGDDLPPPAPTGAETEGIQIPFTGADPAGFGAGSWNWVQVHQGSTAGSTSGFGYGKFLQTLTPNTDLVDGRLPYEFVIPGTDYFGDAPGWPCNADSSGTFWTHESLVSWVHDEFDAYLVYKPAGTNTIYVPVKKFHWNWGGRATFTGTTRLDPASWTLGGTFSTPTPAPGTAGAFPGWYNFAGDTHDCTLQTAP